MSGVKWGKLDGDGRGFSRTRRAARKFKEDELDAEHDTYSLEEYQEYLKTLKPGYDSSKSTVSLSSTKLAQLKRAHAKRNRGLGLSDAADLIAALQRRDKAAIKLISDNHIRFIETYGRVNWTDEQHAQVFDLLIQINDVKLLDLIYAQATFRQWSYPQISESLLKNYTSSNTPEQKKKFYDLFNYFLDVGGMQVRNYQPFIVAMLNAGDIHFVDLLLNHEVSYSHLSKPSQRTHEILMELAKRGDKSIPYFERILEEVPTLLELNNPFSTYNFPLDYQHPLQIASQAGWENLVRFLLKNGANPNTRVYQRETSKYPYSVAKNDYIRGILKAHSQKISEEPVVGEVAMKAMKRIMRDWKEVMEDPPSDSVRVFPDESNMFEWHVVLTPPASKHPLTGINFHFIMTFPKNYPESPPSIKGSQYLQHPNYFSSGWICLNMLREPTPGYAKYSGWSSAYSALSILMNLQSFLFDEEVDQDYGGSVTNEIGKENIKRMMTDCIRFQCKKCGFNHTWKGFELRYTMNIEVMDKDLFMDKVRHISDLPFMGPPSYGYAEDPSQLQPKKQKTKFVSNASLLNLPGAELLLILDLLVRPEDLWAVLRVCKQIYTTGEKYGVWTRRELICYYNKSNFLEDVLGVGLSVQRHNSGKIKTISSPLDYISRTAFFHDYLRSSAWMEPFDYWLPLVINDRHMQKALPYMKAAITAIVMQVSFIVDDYVLSQRREGNQVVSSQESEEKLLPLADKFDPLMVLDVLPKLMNRTIVSMMRSEEGDNSEVMLHHSEKALLGYCSYHHMLLEMCRRYPVIQQKIDNAVQQFARHESARVKLAQPDLGELLVYLSVASNVAWRNISIVFLQELFDRNVVWMLEGDTNSPGHGELAYLETESVSQYRLKTTFNASTTGLRLLMFQVFFLDKVGRPQGLSRKDVLQRLNDAYGRPQPGVPRLLQQECEKIYNVKSYPEFFSRIGVSCPSKEGLCSILKEAVKNSERKGYHVNNLTEDKLLSWRSRVDHEFYKAHPGAAFPTAAFPASTQAPPTASTTPTTNTTTTSSKPTGAPPVKIFVGNLSYRVTALDLEYVFKQFGKLVSAEVLCDAAGKSRGFGYIEVENDQVAATLLEFMQGADVDRRPVRLERVLPRGERKSFNNAAPHYNKPRHNTDDNRNGREDSRYHNRQEREATPSKAAPKPAQQKAKPTKSTNKKANGNGMAAQNPFANLDEE